jgi:hypothetical protein
MMSYFRKWCSLKLVTPIEWYQIALMTILVLIGILLNLVAYRWMTHADRAKSRDRQFN